MSNKFIILLTGGICGISWGLVYILFATLHGMPMMFNGEFIFFIALILKIEISTITSGILFSFLDGLLVGILVGAAIIKIQQRNVKQ